ncbi:hypothetical protein [Actinomadura rudentiformis]|uniref:Uncharacterized protein n=1 Tax=Actinomadura rudentiformis TaxID=359158 RepID=A0A6H9YUJ9_9ACTN|nr:hypothetical protein [Actinomadura rudentiformis]KAB2347336.1 hypothetical protein F8566_20200 [Actinomadura rudentiformis]
MDTITAREAVPGTVVCVHNSDDWLRGLPAPGLSYHWITVGRWEANGDGTATLIASDGSRCGIFAPDDIVGRPAR